MKGNQSENINNPIGAYVTTYLCKRSSPRLLIVLYFLWYHFLSVAETEPVESLLDIYWETSLSGKIADLNALVNSQYGGLVGSNFTAASFPESVTDANVLGSTFNFTDGSGSTVITATLVI